MEYPRRRYGLLGVFYSIEDVEDDVNNNNNNNNNILKYKFCHFLTVMNKVCTSENFAQKN